MTDLYGALARADLQRIVRGAVLFLAAVVLCWNLAVSWKVFGREPLREAASRSLMAASSSFFYASGLAEPVPVAALKAGMALGADPDKAVRFEGAAVLLLVCIVTFLALRPFGGLAAGMAVLFLGFNPYMGYYAIQGSSHLYALLFLLLFWRYFDHPEEGRRGALLAGVFGGLACLSRLDSAWILLIIAALSWAVRRRAFGLKEAGLALGLAFLLTLPYLAWQKAQYGSSLYAQELSLRRWANIDAYGYEPDRVRPQGPLTLSGFILRDGPAGFVREMFGGLGRSLSYELPRTLYHKFLILLSFLGVYAVFARRNYGLLFLLAAALLPVMPLAAIKQVPATGGIELRYFLGAVWALCALAALGFQETLAWTEKAITKWALEKAFAASKPVSTRE